MGHDTITQTLYIKGKKVKHYHTKDKGIFFLDPSTNFGLLALKY